MPRKLAILSLSALFLIAYSAGAQQVEGDGGKPVRNQSSQDLPPVTPPNRPVIGIALEGGGALGFAHIGVLQWLEEHRIPVDRISGTSMGALAGAVYATGATPAEMRTLALSKAISSVFTFETPYSTASFRRRQDRRDIPQVLTIGLKGRYGLRNALLADSGLNQFLNREFFAYTNRNLDYDRLPIPFRCVATDLTTLQAVSFKSGPLSEAVRASLSLPGVFSPVQAGNGDSLVDGGIVDNLPTGVLRSELHADIVVAVHLEIGNLSASDTGSIVGVLDRAFSAGIMANEVQSEKLADIVVDVPTGSFSTTDYDKANELIQAGYNAAEQNRTALLRYALDESGWQAHLAARQARRLTAPGVLRTVQVVGGEPGAVQEVERDLKPAEGKPVSSRAVYEGLKDVQADGEYEANYETFTLPQNPASTPPDAGILVHLQKEPGGPPFLLVGPEVAASTSNVTREEVALRLINQGLGGFGSEFRASARIGYLTDLGAEYYRLLSPSGYYVQPDARVLRQPVYIWTNQKRIAERFQQNLDAGFEAGRTIGNSMQIAAHWDAEDTHWSLRTGNDGGGYISGTAQTGTLRFVLDKAATDSISPAGTRLSLTAGALYHAVDSDNAPLLRMSFNHTHPLGDTNILGIGGDINSYLRARVAEPFQFTLGGPMRLSASSFDEYRGTDTSLARMGMMHRLAALPTGLGQGLYAVVGYEAGEIWSPAQKAILRQDGTTGLVAATPLGLVTFGVSVGDAGHRKVFFTIGRWF
jgi:NTE family protein